MIPLNYGVQLVTRSEWGARAPRSVTHLASGKVTSHWEGPHMGSFSHGSCAGKVRGIQDFHMDSRGWNDIAYNAVACPHGYVFEGRGQGVRSAANGTNAGNDGAYAVCYLGGEGDPFGEEGKRAMKAGGDWLTFPGSARNGHRDWKSTQCPGDDIYRWTHAGQPVLWGPPPPEEDTLSAEEVKQITDEVWDSRPFFASTTDDGTQPCWVVYKDNGTKRWVRDVDMGKALLLDRVYAVNYNETWPHNGFPKAWVRTRAHLDLYETVGGSPPGWEAGA